MHFPGKGRDVRGDGSIAARKWGRWAPSGIDYQLLQCSSQSFSGELQPAIQRSSLFYKNLSHWRPKYCAFGKGV